MVELFKVAEGLARVVDVREMSYGKGVSIVGGSCELNVGTAIVLPLQSENCVLERECQSLSSSVVAHNGITCLQKRSKNCIRARCSE